MHATTPGYGPCTFVTSAAEGYRLSSKKMLRQTQASASGCTIPLSPASWCRRPVQRTSCQNQDNKYLRSKNVSATRASTCLAPLKSIAPWLMRTHHNACPLAKLHDSVGQGYPGETCIAALRTGRNICHDTSAFEFESATCQTNNLTTLTFVTATPCQHILNGCKHTTLATDKTSGARCAHSAYCMSRLRPD